MRNRKRKRVEQNDAAREARRERQRIARVANENHKQLPFTSISALGTYCQDAPILRAHCTSINGGPDSGASYDETLVNALHGGRYPEGVDMMRVHETDTLQEYRSQFDTPAPELSPVGYLADVPSVLLDVPEFMWADSATVERQRLITVGVDIGVSWAVDANQIQNRGAAILSVVEGLTQCGFAVEVTAVWRDTEDNNRGDSITVSLPVKQSDASLDLEAAAFCFANPAFLRRLMFRVLEADKDFCEWPSYGYPSSKNLDGYNVSFSGLNSGDEDASDYDNMDRAMVTAIAKFDRYLQQGEDIA